MSVLPCRLTAEEDHDRSTQRPADRHHRRPADRPVAAARADAVPHTGLPPPGAGARVQHVRGRRLDGGAGVGGHPDRRRSRPAVHRRPRPERWGCCSRPWSPGSSPTGCPRSRSCSPSPSSSWPAWRWSRSCPSTDLTEVWHLAAVAFMTGVGHGVLLPRLLRLAARPGARVRPPGGQRLRGHGAARRSGRPSGPASPAPWSASLARSRLRRRRGRVPVAACSPWSTVPQTAVRRDLGETTRRPPGPVGLRRHARGLRLHGPHAVAAGHAALRLADDPGDDGPARGADPVPGQGQARRRAERPRAGAGRVRHRWGGGLAGDGVGADAAPLPHADEHRLGRRLPAVPGHRVGHRRCGVVVVGAA